MHSAFGVEHDGLTEISKGKYKLVKIPKHKVASGPPGPSGAQKLIGRISRAGDAQISIRGIGRAAGRGAGKLSSAVETHPGVAGTALVGGGGAAGYKYLSNKEPKKKR